MKAEDTYNTIKANSEGMYKDKGSKFISFIYPISNEEDVKDLLQGIRKEHYSARHHCYAYRLGNYGELFRMNDDGEPSGTAGRPIYGQLLSAELTNTLLIVVRYFGGTLLGVSGLINAYKNAAADAIVNSEVVTRIIQKSITLRFSYQIQNVVMRIVKDEHLEVISSDFGEDCILQVKVRLSRSEMIVSKLKSIYGLVVTDED